MNKDFSIGTYLAISILIAFIAPFLIFWVGWAVGWVASLIIGGPLVKGFNALGIHIEVSQIPIITGALAWVGSILGTNKIININKNE